MCKQLPVMPINHCLREGDACYAVGVGRTYRKHVSESPPLEEIYIISP